MLKKSVLTICLLVTLCGFAYADCSKMISAICDQTYSVSISGIDINVYFSEAIFGPCPSGKCEITWQDNYVAVPYSTESDYVIIEGVGKFLLHGDSLILVHDATLVLDLIGE